MSTVIPPPPRLFGLFELDETGVVLYSRIEDEGAKQERSDDLTGSNFFKILETFADGDEIRAKITSFVRGEPIFIGLAAVIS